MSRTFIFNWKVTLFAAICLVSFTNLGFWQLAREVEKRELLADMAQKESSPPLSASELRPDSDLGGTRVRLVGGFEESFWLLDNRVLDGRVGFEVLQVFAVEGGRRFLVNRGFVPMGRTRQDAPDIANVHNEKTTIVGRIYVNPRGSAKVHKNDSGSAREEADVQHERLPIVQDAEPRMIDESLFVHLVRLETGQYGSLPRHWPSTVMQPEQHRGYAIQWFAMALAVLVAWLFFSFRTQSRNAEEN